MFEHIDPRSPIPLYDQIATRIRSAVAAAELAPGDVLPSVRQLAKRLRVNPATVVQAYRELEGEGFVEMRQGAGTFVCEVEGTMRKQARSEQAKRLVRAMLKEAARLGLDGDELAGALQRELGGKA
jgi:GntR family transcriptional regulator